MAAHTHCRRLHGLDAWRGRAPPGRGDKPYASDGRVAQVESLFAHIYSEPESPVTSL